MNKTLSFFLTDDDIDDTGLFKEVLNRINPSVRFQAAGDGQEALLKLRAGNAQLPDVIFLDLNMPRMGGIDCLKELKTDPILKDIPVIIYTTSSQSRDIEEALMSGAACFITKPPSMKELGRILTTISENLPHNLDKALRQLGTNSSTFIVC